MLHHQGCCGGLFNAAVVRYGLVWVEGCCCAGARSCLGIGGIECSTACLSDDNQPEHHDGLLRSACPTGQCAEQRPLDKLADKHRVHLCCLLCQRGFEASQGLSCGLLLLCVWVGKWGRGVGLGVYTMFSPPE